MDLQKPEQPARGTRARAELPFPIVGIGASAGSFPALATLLQNLPASPGIALVIVLHLPPDQQSKADRVLQRATRLPVVQVDHPMPILPEHVYVIPPAHGLAMEGGRLVLRELAPTPGDPATIDAFFRTLAMAHREKAIGVILSGMGADGTAGLARIREQGGVSVVQAPADAEQASMPKSAIDAGMADFVLTAEQIPAKLMELRGITQAIREQALRGHAPPEVCIDMGPDPEQALKDVLALLHEHTGHDFHHYKRSTLLRRLERRLQVRGQPDLLSYGELQRRDAAESHALLKDLLIGVTQFFRDRDAFAALEQRVVPNIFQDKGPDDTVRVWAAACSTGEEAYSLAMLLADHAATMADPPAIQVFASDIDAQAIRTARAGLYPASIAADVPPDRLQRHFTIENGACKVRKALRQQVLFAEHNLLHDPPFSSLDLISCRNFLIYLNQDTHRQVLEMFHFALRPGGYLMLGSAETVDDAADLFAPVDAGRRLYRVKPGPEPRPGRPAPAAPLHKALHAAQDERDEPPGRQRSRSRLFSFAEIHLHKAAEQAPPSILVNENAEIVHIAAQASRFLRHTGGEPTRDLVALVPSAWRLELRTALFQAQKSGREASTGPVRYEQDGEQRAIDMTVLPFHDEHAEGLLMLVSFREVGDLQAAVVPTEARDQPLLEQLDEELRHTRHKLLETMDQAEQSGATLRTTVEELKSTIEELRSMNRQLEATLERTRAANEELETTNADLTQRLESLGKSHDDLNNLIASSNVATLFLDRAMRIQRYTPRITDIFNLIPADVGRPLLHITSRLDNVHLAEESARVFETLQPLEQEVRSEDGRYYIVRVHPYRTGSHHIDGAVMSFFDITSRRVAEKALRESEQRLALAFAALPVGICTVDTAGNVIMLNEVMKRFLPTGRIPSRDRGQAPRWRGWNAAGDPIRPEDFPGARALRGEDVLPGIQMLYLDDDGKEIWTEVRSEALRDGEGNITGALVVVIDVDRLKRSEEEARRNARRTESILEHMGDAHSVLDRDYRIVVVNAAAEGLLGRPRAELLGRSHWDAFPASVDAPVGRALRRVVEEGVEQHLTHHYTGEGYDMHIEVDAYPTDEGGVAMFWRDVTDRVRAEGALRASEEKYRALFNEMDEAYAVVEVIADADGRWADFLFLDVNPAFMRHTGMPYPVGRTATQLLGTPNPRWAELYGRVVQTGEPVRLEEGELLLGRVFDLNIFRLGGEDSRRVAVLFTNVTERKHAEAALRESERRYRLLFENMIEGFALAELIRDPDGRPVDWRYLEVNAAWTQTGIAAADAVGKTIREVIPSVEPYWIDTYGQVVDTGQPVRFENWAAGFGKWFDTVAFRHSENRFGLLFRDVTEWHRAYAALRASETRYRELFESIDEGFVVADILYDEQGRVADALYLEGNPAASRMTGVPDFAGRRLTELMPGAGSDGLEIYDRVVRSGVAERLERYAAPLGRWYDVHVSRAADPAPDEAGEERRRVVILFQDITARKQAEDALKLADRRKDDFLATLAHELRNPLAPISNALQFLRDPGGKRRADRLLTMVERQVRHMVRLVDDLMEVSRISRGKVDLRRAPVALTEVLRSAVEASLPAFEEKHQPLTIDVPDETLKLNADKDRLTQVFANLLNNAAKYTPAGGQVRLGAHRDGAHAVVKVSDTGMGIGAEQLTHIFEMFSQPHGRNGHTDSGLGIGLAMVRSLVDLHGGVVRAHSEGPGKGSEFVVCLPLLDCPDSALRTTESPVDLSGMPLAGRRILIVDDNRDAADSLRELLAAHGADAMVVYDGPSAIQAVKDSPPHAVVLDIGMPDMDGYEVARQIRQDPRAEAITLIALSGWGQAIDRARSRACGFDHHLTKPADLGSLVRILGQGRAA